MLLDPTPDGVLSSGHFSKVFQFCVCERQLLPTPQLVLRSFDMTKTIAVSTLRTVLLDWDEPYARVVRGVAYYPLIQHTPRDTYGTHAHVH
jgi:hypothetical protein